MNGKIQEQEDITQYLEDVYKLIAKCDLEQAFLNLDKAYSIDFDSPVLNDLFRMMKFWRERWNRISELPSPYEKGDYLLNQWDQFLLWFKDKKKEPEEKGLQAIKTMVHAKSLDLYDQLYNCDIDDQQLMLRIGRCHKVLGNYEKAAALLEKGARLNKDNPVVLAELADTYALMDEMKGAKIFFREAFFIEPSVIDLSKMESGLIGKIIEKVSDFGYEKKLINEWLPVYAVLFGVFNVKRELRPIEYGKLRQSIFSLQNDLRQGEESEELVPRLINKYFWLIDHYISIKEDRRTIDEVLMNIKLLSPSIYQQYIN